VLFVRIDPGLPVCDPVASHPVLDTRPGMI
jgi:hypothetical protein